MVFLYFFDDIPRGELYNIERGVFGPLLKICSRHLSPPSPSHELGIWWKLFLLNDLIGWFTSGDLHVTLSSFNYHSSAAGIGFHIISCVPSGDFEISCFDSWSTIELWALLLEQFGVPDSEKLRFSSHNTGEGRVQNYRLRALTTEAPQLSSLTEELPVPRELNKFTYDTMVDLSYPSTPVQNETHTLYTAISDRPMSWRSRKYSLSSEPTPASKGMGIKKWDGATRQSSDWDGLRRVSFPSNSL